LTQIDVADKGFIIKTLFLWAFLVVFNVLFLFWLMESYFLFAVDYDLDLWNYPQARWRGRIRGHAEGRKFPEKNDFV